MQSSREDDHPGVGQSSPDLAFECVYRTHLGYVLRLTRQLGVDPADLEDAVQDVFVVIHRRLQGFDPTRATLKTWIFAIARRVAANRRRVTHNRLRPLPPQLGQRSSESPEAQAGQRQTLALVDRFLRGLPEVQREVFMLVELEGFRAPEAAQALDVNVNTVYSRLRAGRMAFETYLRSVDGELEGVR